MQSICRSSGKTVWELLFIHLNNSLHTFLNALEAKHHYRFTGALARDSSCIFKPLFLTTVYKSLFKEKWLQVPPHFPFPFTAEHLALMVCCCRAAQSLCYWDWLVLCGTRKRLFISGKAFSFSLQGKEASRTVCKFVQVVLAPETWWWSGHQATISPPVGCSLCSQPSSSCCSCMLGERNLPSRNSAGQPWAATRSLGVLEESNSACRKWAPGNNVSSATGVWIMGANSTSLLLRRRTTFLSTSPSGLSTAPS